MIKKLRVILGDISALKKDAIKLNAEVSKLQNAATELQQAERDMRARLESLEAYQRNDNVVIRGLAEASYAEVG